MSSRQMLGYSSRFAGYAVKAYWQRHRVMSRLIALALILLLVFGLIKPILDQRAMKTEQPLSSLNNIIGDPVELYAKKISVNEDSGTISFNEGYAPGGDVSGDSASPKISASFAGISGSAKVTVKDPVSSTEISFTPKFKVSAPKTDKNRVYYRFFNGNGYKVYTNKASGVKEDIVLTEAPKSEILELNYEYSASDGVELRVEGDGSMGVYGVSDYLLSNVSTGSESDAELLKQARLNGEKNNLLFRIPAPFVVESGKRRSSVNAWYSLKGNNLSVHATNFDGATYPLSIDPSIYVESARKLMRGNNETNIDFDTTNELIQKSQTTGARIDGWVDTTDMSAGVWDQSMAYAGGFVYRAGGRVDPTVPYIISQTSTQVSTAGTTFAMNMPSERPSGDLYVAVISRVGSGTVTPPAGWLLYSTGTNVTTTTRDVVMYYRVGSGTEPATYSWTNSASVQWTGTIIRIKGFDNASPISAAATATTGTATAVSPPVFPAVTPAHDASLIIRAVGINEVDPSDYTWLPSGHTKLHGSTSISGTASSTALVVTSLDTPPIASNSAAAASLAIDGIMVGNYGAISVAIRPASVTAGYQNTVEWARINDQTFTIDSPNPGNGTCASWCNNSAYNLPANRVGMSMVAYNGFLYALGGTTDGTVANAQSTVWVAKLGVNGEPQLWHPTGGTPGYWFVSSQTLPSARSYASIYAYKNRLYLTGGRDTAGSAISSTHYANLLPTGDIGSWSTSGMQSLPSARWGHSIHIYNDVMYLIGGGASSTGSLLNTVHYSRLNSDGSMNAWVDSGQNFSTARSSFGGQFTAVWGAYIYLAGGCSAITSGYCSTIASDVQLASINADGTIAPWNSIATLSNQRIGHSFIAWQGGLYRFGGCNRQNTSTGVCYATHRNVEYGPVNPPGDASTVSNSEPSGSGTCVAVNYTNCDLPPAGDGSGQGGQMSSAVVVNNGFIYVIGGCTNVSQTDECTGPGAVSAMSGNISYAAINSLGQMVAPANCPAPNTSYGLWCVDSTNQINGTAGVGTAAATVFNNRIYVIGGTDGTNWQSNVWSVLLNADGSLGSAWSSQTFTNLALGTARGYSYAFTRSNPSSSTTPGNLYVIGGCNGGTTADGVGCNTYYTEVYKCNILASGLLDEANATDCDTANQLQVDADTSAGATGSQGIGLMSGTVYANRIYLIGGACPAAGTTGPCRTAYSGNREDTMYARINSSNNIVNDTTGLSTGNWSFTTAKMNPVRRRAVGFGYNGYIYSLAGYSGTASLQDLLFAKINVSTGDISSFDSSGVVVTPRWDLKAVVSNGYVYALGGCGTGDAPAGCTAMQPEIQTFQLYNNNSGTPISYGASANLFGTDRFGASSAILNGVLYVAGGCTSTDDCTTATNDVQYATIDVSGNISSAWTTGNALPAVRTWGQLEAAGGSLYYVGGQSSTSTDERSEVYYSSSFSGANPTWSTATNGLPAARTQFSASVWDDRIYVTGGLDSSAAAQTTVYVSPRLSSSVSSGNITSAWSTSTAFNVARSGHALVAYANNLYLLGGYDGTNYLNDVQYASIGYKSGTISQSGANVTGSGTSWTTAMIGSTLQYRDGEIATILTVPSGTTMTVSVSKNVTAGTGYTILDGSVGSWTYTTSLPEPIRQADAFASNGYIYLVGGRSSNGDCTSNTLLAPISANTTIATGNNATGVGEWYETNVKYTGERYGNSVAYLNGKMYITGGACQSTPYVHTILSQTFTTDTTAHAVTMPSTVDAGDLLIVLIGSDDNSTITDPDGAGAWTQIATAASGSGGVTGTIYAKDAAGTEDGTTVDFVTSATQKMATQVYRIPAAYWEGNIGSVEASAASTSTGTTTPDPASLNPAGWASPSNTLWLSFVAGSRYASVTSYPANHTNGQMTVSGTDTTGASVSSSRIETNADSENPGTYTMNASQASVAYTIAVRPAAFSLTGANRTVQTALYSQPQVASYSRLIDTDTDVFPTSWLMNGLDNSIGARWRANYRTMHDISDGASQQNPNEDCGTSATMPIMSDWGQASTTADVTLGDVYGYTPVNSSGGNINCARYYYFYVSIDASQTFGYPEDVNRGPTISDLSLFFTSDPSKRLRHGKTFTGGEQQPLDSPCRQSVDANCPLP
jgi:N-acetylneuraminic acid mutarotase